MLVLGCSLGLTSCGSAPKPNPPEVQLMVNDMIEQMRFNNQMAREQVQRNLSR